MKLQLPIFPTSTSTQPELRNRNGWHRRPACAVRPLAGRKGPDAGTENRGVENSGRFSPFRAAGRRSAQATGLCHLPEMSAATSEFGLNFFGSKKKFWKRFRQAQ